MGYYTYFGGNIKLVDEQAINIIRYFLKEGLKPFDEVWDLIVESDGEIEISGEGKYYNDEIQKICYFIHLIDKNAEGEIKCEGEDSFDIWKITLGKKGVGILRGEVVYNLEKEFVNENIQEQINKISKDKNLNKKIILSNLKEKWQN